MNSNCIKLYIMFVTVLLGYCVIVLL